MNALERIGLAFCVLSLYVLPCRGDVHVRMNENHLEISYVSSEPERCPLPLKTSNPYGNGLSMVKKATAGRPAVPVLKATIVLPPDCDPASVKVSNADCSLSARACKVLIKPARRAVPLDRVFNLVPPERTNHNNPQDPFPPSPFRIVGCGKAGPYKILMFEIAPYQYYERSGTLRRITKGGFRISFRRQQPPIQIVARTYISSMKSVLRTNVVNPEMLDNYAPFLETSSDADTVDYVILTTSSFVSQSRILDDFINHRSAQGLRVRVVTEADFHNQPCQPPHATEEKVRAWLQDNYLESGLRYVLIIADPRASYGQIPMKQVFPRLGSSEYTDIDRCHTDYYYADLTGNWDIDGDLLYGEYFGDRGAGGVDFFPEVVVGRIPWFGSVDEVDNVLRKIIEYETVEDIPAWRKRALLPAAIAFYENQVEVGSPGLDGAEFACQLSDNVLSPLAIGSFSLFEKAGIRPSPYICDSSLTAAHLLDEWQNGYGMVCLFGHGSFYGIYRTVWNYDDGDSIPESGEYSLPVFLESSDTALLNDAYPSQVFLAACNNAMIGYPSSLAFSLLRHGGVNVIAATAPAFGEIGSWHPYLNTSEALTIAYCYFEQVLQSGNTTGEAFYGVKSSLGCDLEEDDWHNLMAFNLFGDPALVSVPWDTYTSADSGWTLYR